MFEFLFKCHWSLFLRVELTIFQHWFRWWLGAGQATSHYLNQWWLVYRRIYASLGLNELNHVCERGPGRLGNEQHASWAQLLGGLYPDSKVHGANMGPTWVLSAPEGPHDGHMSLAIRVGLQETGDISSRGLYKTELWFWNPPLGPGYRVQCSVASADVTWLNWCSLWITWAA